jgi:hypothetical protein
VLVIVSVFAVAASALAAVLVYSNGFNSRQSVKELKGAETGKRCERGWSKKRGQLRVTLKRAPGVCTYKPPVQSDGPRPDYRLEAKGKISKGTGKNVRDNAYLTVSVRVGGGNRYELRIFPKGQQYVLRRQPSAGGFPASGTSPEIGKIGKKNRVLLAATGNELRAKVNGATVATVTDGNASQLDGRRLEFGVGSDADSKRDTVGTFSKLAVSVPNP